VNATPSLLAHERERITRSGILRRRVLEETRVPEQRRDETRFAIYDRILFERDWPNDLHRRGRVFEIAGGDQGDGALVGGVAVNAIVKLRRSGEGDAENEGADQTEVDRAFHGCGDFAPKIDNCKIDMCVVPVRQQSMLGPTKIYFIVFGLLTIAGGIVGYFKAGSMASIVAGAIAGILLLVSAWLLPEHLAAGLTIALITSVLLAGRFVPKFLNTGKVMPAGLMSILSVIGIVMAMLAWVRK
jgi:uncharacterized membrane protein (UPF0136 family)